MFFVFVFSFFDALFLNKLTSQKNYALLLKSAEILATAEVTGRRGKVDLLVCSE